MPKSCLEIAKDLGLSKQAVYRYIKANNIKEVEQSGQVKLYDDAVKEQIKRAFEKKHTAQKSTSNNINDMLLKQIESQQKTIEQLTKLLDQEQQLRMVAEQKLIAIEEKKEEKQPKKFFWFQWKCEETT